MNVGARASKISRSKLLKHFCAGISNRRDVIHQAHKPHNLVKICISLATRHGAITCELYSIAIASSSRVHDYDYDYSYFGCNRLR